MKLVKVALMAAAAIVTLLIAAFAAMGFVVFDLWSYTATGSETLSPEGISAGKALVAYDPGVSGGAKDAAVKITEDLRSRGYEVVLAGIRSGAAADTSGYDVIVAGGPVYVGNASSSVRSYLTTLTSPEGAKVGVFGCGGMKLASDDLESVLKDVASLPEGSALEIKSAIKLLPEDDAEGKCARFVEELLE